MNKIFFITTPTSWHTDTYATSYPTTICILQGQVQNDRLCIRYRRNPQKIKAEEAKSLHATSLCYSNTKSTLLVPLTFIKFEKTKHKNSNFVHLLSSSLPCITQKLYGVCKYYAYQTTALLLEIIPTFVEQ